MESIVFEDSPLAAYLEGQGEGRNHNEGSSTGEQEPVSAESSPSFAPRGKPTVRQKFRQKLPPPLRLAIPQNSAAAVIHHACSKAVNSRLGRADNARFLERFRYLIITSQLLNPHAYPGSAPYAQSGESSTLSQNAPKLGTLSVAGVAVTAGSAFTVAWLIHWTRNAWSTATTKARGTVFMTVGLFAVLAYTYIRRQWLQYLRQQTLTELSTFISRAQEFDTAVAAALTLVQEVELVSRGYRVSSPLPPISRLEDQSQTRRCSRLRKVVRTCLANVLPRYSQACAVLKPLAVEMDLEKYYDVYDISDTDFAESMLSYSETEFEDAESLRVLKILTARLHIIRKVFLCILLALDAHGGKPDFTRWSAVVDEIQGVSTITGEVEEKLRQILSEEDSFPVPPTPKIPLTPGRERWRAQLRKLNNLSSGIRGLQAKLHLLRDESGKALNDTEDVTELGANLMIQYESVGVDLKALMREWEDGKAALASTIDRNERRISSMSGMLSPTLSLGGRTAVEDGSAQDALKALNGETLSRSSMEFSSSDAEEVFEAVALPRHRSSLTRAERIVKMRDDRAKKESMKDKAEASTRMLRELESVINMRPRGRPNPAGRVTSM